MRTCLIVVMMLAAMATRAFTSQEIAFARVFPNAGQVGLFIAASDGSDEHPLLASRDVDYDPVWLPDGMSIVFTSERAGSADLFRVNPDGSGLERLTDDPAYDDQAAFSPDSKHLVFVSTRGGGTAHLWTIDLLTRRTKRLTFGRGGDFRPSWSPDGQWIAFSSDRGSALPFGYGRWERLQLADLYIIRPDGSDLKRISEHGHFCGSPKWMSDSRHVVAYCMTAEQTLATRRPAPEPGSDTRLVSIDATTGASADLQAGAGVKIPRRCLEMNWATYAKIRRVRAPVSTTRAAREDLMATCAPPRGRQTASEWSFTDDSPHRCWPFARHSAVIPTTT